MIRGAGAGQGAGGEGDLEVVAAGVAVEVENFAAEEKAGAEARSHGLGDDFLEADTAGRHHGALETFVVDDGEGPGFEALRKIFEKQTWYKPVTSNASSLNLNEVERINIALIQNMEKVKAKYDL